MKIQLDFRFDSAHFLPLVPDDHKCKMMHGHTYWAAITLEGNTDALGWVMDFADVREKVKPVIAKLDHTLLNSVVGLENPTVENITRYIFHELEEELEQLSSVEVKETPFSKCIYTRKDASQKLGK